MGSEEAQEQKQADSDTTVEPTSSEIESEDSQQSPSAVDESTASDGGEAGELPEEQQQRPRVRLNPTIDAGQAQAVPSMLRSQTAPIAPGEAIVSPEATESSQTLAAADSSSDEVAETATTAGVSDMESPNPNTELPNEDTAETSESQQEPQSSEDIESPTTPAPRIASVPIELPPAVDVLGDELEAEIEAALASGELDNAVVSVEQSGTEPEAEEEPLTEEDLEPGRKMTGRIQSIHGDDVFLDLNLRSPGMVSGRQFDVGRKPTIGQLIEVVVDRVDEAEGLVHLNLPKGLRKAGGSWDSVATGQIVDCMVSKTNKGGLDVTVGGLRGFLPASQVDLNFVSDLETYVGQKLRVKITEANRKKRNLVVSRRAFLQIERQEAETQLWKTLEIGQQFTGTVKSIKDYGAFIDIGGVDGFLHIGEISWSRISNPAEVLSQGQEVDVKVISLDAEKKKIGLGMRQLTQNPWAGVTERYATGTTISGKVTRTADFGAFVELEPGVEGLIHISELEHRRVKRVLDVLNVGQEIDAKVLEVDANRKRISLSLKALREEPAKEGQEAETAEPIQRKRTGPLKGGIGTSGPGGLFGNPGDYS